MKIPVISIVSIKVDKLGREIVKLKPMAMSEFLKYQERMTQHSVIDAHQPCYEIPEVSVGSYP
jgi:hypothetical protein